MLVLALDETPPEPVLGPLGSCATHLRVVADAAELGDELAGLVIVRSPLNLDSGLLDALEHVLLPDGVLLALGDPEQFALIGEWFPHVVTWHHKAELHTAIVPAPTPHAGSLVLAGRRPLPDLSPAIGEAHAVDLTALAEERILRNLAAVVAERQMLVSTLEGDVVALYHRESHRTAAGLRMQLAAALEGTRTAEDELHALRESVSWRLTAPLRALGRAAGRRRG